MKLKNEIFAPNNSGVSPFVVSLGRLLDSDISVENAMKLYRLNQNISAWGDIYQKARTRVLTQFGTPMNNGAFFSFDNPENKRKCDKAIKTIDEKEFDIDGEKIDLSQETMKLKAIDVILLKELITGLPEVKEPVAPEEDVLEERSPAIAKAPAESPIPPNETIKTEATVPTPETVTFQESVPTAPAPEATLEPVPEEFAEAVTAADETKAEVQEAAAETPQA
jgi:hypothetical protein